MLEEEESQFVAVFGRRRIGKTMLIRESFNYQFTFQHTGLSNNTLKSGDRKQAQLDQFAISLAEAGYRPEEKLRSWSDAFSMLKQVICRSKEKKKVIFLDELSWMDTNGSDLIPALEHFWNGWVTARREKDVVLIICASATYWMIDRIVNAKGGLHNRLSGQIHLKPFTLGECEEYLHANGCVWDRYTILQCYMALGGVPYYLSLLNPEQSLAQNIDRLFFVKNAPMREEFDELFNALYSHADKYIAVMNALSESKKGLLRAEIIEKTGQSGGRLTKVLENLERCDFIETYSQYKSSVRNSVYRICDPYTLFYFKFLDGKNTKDEHWWTNNIHSHSVESWQGFSFETICMTHLEQIKQRLGISGISTTTGTWRMLGDETEKGAQIDLVIDRSDRVINLCEMKFSEAPYTITKDYEEKLRNRLAIFRAKTKTRKSLATTMVTTYGVLRGIHSGIVQNEVVMDDLFRQ